MSLLLSSSAGLDSSALLLRPEVQATVVVPAFQHRVVVESVLVVEEVDTKNSFFCLSAETQPQAASMRTYARRLWLVTMVVVVTGARPGRHCSSSWFWLRTLLIVCTRAAAAQLPGHGGEQARDAGPGHVKIENGLRCPSPDSFLCLIMHIADTFRNLPLKCDTNICREVLRCES